MSSQRIEIGSKNAPRKQSADVKRIVRSIAPSIELPAKLPGEMFTLERIGDEELYRITLDDPQPHNLPPPSYLIRGFDKIKRSLIGWGFDAATSARIAGVCRTSIRILVVIADARVITLRDTKPPQLQWPTPKE